jgi:non-ribosomal peptide synthetase component F
VLIGLEAATLVAPNGSGRAPVLPEKIPLSLSEAQSAALSQLARRHGLTLNTIVQAAWAILLGRLTAREEVVFGVTVAGRPPELAGIESMVGLFINTLPLRTTLPPGKPLLELLRDLQEGQSRLMVHQHLGLAEIECLVGVGELFDTVVAFENYPVDNAGMTADADGLRLSGVSVHDATHYSLRLMVVPGDRLRLVLDYRSDLFTRASAEALGERLVRLLRAAIAEPNCPIGHLDMPAADACDMLAAGQAGW